MSCRLPLLFNYCCLGDVDVVRFRCCRPLLFVLLFIWNSLRCLLLFVVVVVLSISCDLLFVVRFVLVADVIHLILLILLL